MSHDSDWSIIPQNTLDQGVIIDSGDSPFQQIYGDWAWTVEKAQHSFL